MLFLRHADAFVACKTVVGPTPGVHSFQNRTQGTDQPSSEIGAIVRARTTSVMALNSPKTRPALKQSEKPDQFFAENPLQPVVQQRRDGLTPQQPRHILPGTNLASSWNATTSRTLA